MERSALLRAPGERMGMGGSPGWGTLVGVLGVTQFGSEPIVFQVRATNDEEAANA